MAQTTITLKGKKLPFYRTNRGQFDFEAAGYNTQDMADGKMSAMLAFVYFHSRDCAKRANLPFPFADLDDFVDNTEPDVIAVFTRLKEAEKAVAEGKAQPEAEGKQ